MSNTNETMFPNPEGKIIVIKRYLHILALLQHIPENQETWNNSRLADVISLEEDGIKPLSNDNIRGYIADNIMDGLDISVDKRQGDKYAVLAEDLDIDTQLKIARVYSDFVVKDTTRDIVLRKFIEAMPDKALWTLARIYFAVVEKRMIQINYVTNTGYKINKWQLCPYYVLFRNNNLYLAAWDPKQKKQLSLLAERISNLTVIDKSQSIEWDIPAVDKLFGDSLSAFISDSGPVAMKIRYKKERSSVIENIISPLDPEIKTADSGGWIEAAFNIADYLFLCKQFVMYGSDVEILSPANVRQAMIDMLKESLRVYEG